MRRGVGGFTSWPQPVCGLTTAPLLATALAGTAEAEFVVRPNDEARRWHARGHGLFAANPLDRKAFDRRAEPRQLALDRDETLTFRYLLLILSAPFSAEAAWRELAAEPATWEP